VSKQRKRGTRRIVGYVVSLTGKRGGPYHGAHKGGAYRTKDNLSARNARDYVSRLHPSARVLPVVRYELDREEEALRDVVVEAAIEKDRADMAIRASVLAYEDDHSKWNETAYGNACESCYAAGEAFGSAIEALRAHLEKSK
jgi:hypothetical protein